MGDSYLQNDIGILTIGPQWADGESIVGGGAVVGTFTPPTMISKSSDPENFFEEDPESPIIERGLQCTAKHRYSCGYESGYFYLQGLNRGAIYVDGNGDVWRLLSATLQRIRKPGFATLETVMECLTMDNPPDEFECPIVELNPALEKHPRYAFLTASTRWNVNQAVMVPNPNARSVWLNQIENIPNSNYHPSDAGNTFTGGLGTNQQNHDAAMELYTRRIIGEDTFYLPGFKMTWTRYFRFMPDLNPGGYIEDPVEDGGLDPLFWSSDGTEDGYNVFAQFAAYNKQLYGGGVSWLRLADDPKYERTWIKVASTWLGAPYAHWDGYLYGAESPYPAPPPLPISGV